mmetsp:Transcript_22745/g.33729  ORF Transcript_22745/g.33729 Transcript_22745/m.33729 type:complete len:192 (-) Transcript_22745:364-939(-)
MSETTTSPSDVLAKDPEAWLHSVFREHDENSVVMIVFFRSSSDPYDQEYFKLLKECKPSNSYVVAVSAEAEPSEPKEGVDLVLSDPTHALANYYKEDELLPGITFTDPKDGFPNGMVQPAFIVYAHHGTECAHWEQSDVSEATEFGAANRPEPKALWEAVMHRKHALDNGNAAIPVHGSKLEKVLPPGSFS